MSESYDLNAIDKNYKPKAGVMQSRNNFYNLWDVGTQLTQVLRKL